VVNLIASSEKEQVLLKVNVVEMQRDAIRRLGVDLPQAIASAGAFTFAKVIQGGFPVSSLVNPGAAFTGAGSVPFVSNGSALQATANWNGNTASAIIQAFERAGLSRTLAEPTLTAISGETAKFLAGGEFPVPISNKDNTVTVTWKSFGVNVAFTPYVLSEGRINLKVAAEVSELSSQGAVTLQTISIPAIQVRRAETSVEMPSGSALAIAGLLSDQTRQNVDGVPELRNLPVLGALFRSKDYRSSSSELVILVTPYVVKPTDPALLERPDKGFAPANDLKALVRGHLHRVYKKNGELAAWLDGKDYGFIVEYPSHGGTK
jgi:pilus assembly protein CpaC